MPMSVFNDHIVLAAFAKNPFLWRTQLQMAAATKIERGALSSSLQVLEEGGYLKKASSRGPARYRLSRKGRQHYRHLKKVGML